MAFVARIGKRTGLAVALAAFAAGISNTALAAKAVAADTVQANVQNGYDRLLFNFTPAARVVASATGGVLTLSFDRKVAFNPASITGPLATLLTSGRADPDGKIFRFTLSVPIKLHQSASGTRAVVDLAPENFTGTMPDLVSEAPAVPKPVDPAHLPVLKLRSGSYANFTRLVFDWPRDVPYTVVPAAGKMIIRFAAPANTDLSAIGRFHPPWVKSATSHLDGNATVIEFETDAASGYHDFKDGNKIVLDILAPKTDTAAYAPPGTAKPVPIKITGSMTEAQAQAVADTATQLADKDKPPAKTDAGKKNDDIKKTDDTKKTGDKTAAANPPDVKPPTPALKPAQTEATAKPVPIVTAQAPVPAAATAVAPAPPAGVQAIESRATRDGAILDFKGAGTRGSAVFIRGLTAWIVLQDAPGFDPAAIKSSLGSFALSLDASSSAGVSILRIGLKQPEQIAARGEGADLKVVIAPHVNDTPAAINFARNQDDPKRTSLTAVLPGARKAFPVTDPVTGDVLTIVPASVGRGMPAQRVYAEFAALQSAVGLVVTPYTDDLSVSVTDARVSITRPGGLALTPPQMPASTTLAALAHAGDGPNYLDFAAWGQLNGGSFLATERQLAHAVAQMKAADANHARLMLARFYLANRFAAEARGLINLIEASDPASAGAPQMTVMKAAADYMMGRYRDAHNDLAGNAFDSDRHAALWRGLIEAAQENWQPAQTYLDEASPVIKRYPADWQARAYLSEAEASLGIGRLELADAAMSHLPRDLTRSDALEQQLLKARIDAAENRYRAAQPEFAAVENGGVERLAAQAIFYQADAALGAGVITPDQGIDVLERLRFRWRGDALEMKTLRKLASLYFAKNKWREGLKTLRVATQNFEGNDATRAAQDDMRTAFVNLYLKGAADKMQPVDSLALFYDNIDLTPIGADGDEMIRRMADRLVAVDLLGPAASLLSYQVDKRLDGIAKASVATKLAAVYLMDHKPQAAIDILHKSILSGLPDDVGHQRLLLEARGFAALKQWDNALDLIGVDESVDTRQLRADIYWESGNWAVAGQKAEEMLNTRWSDPDPLTAAERGMVLRMAVSYSLANDEASVERLRTRFSPKMAGTPDASTFAVLSQNIESHGLGFRDAAAQIASVDTLESFMKDFSKRHEMVATN